MKKMLIVDDDWMITESLSTMDEWTANHIDIVGTASNGQEALYWLNKAGIDIVLTDIRMPSMDGLSLAKHIHENFPTIDVIIMSGYEDFSYAQSAIKHNVKGYILKPIDVNELLETVNKLKNETTIKSSIEMKETESNLFTQQERLVLSAKSYINANYMKTITLTDIASKFHLTEHYFSQVFKSTEGRTFMAYLTHIRLEESCKLLENPSLTIYMVSESVGYSDSKYFSRIFRREYGVTPSQYRRNLLKRAD